MWGISKRMDLEKRVFPELNMLRQTCRCLTGNDVEADRLVEETVAETYRTWDTLRYEFNGRIPLFSVLTEQYLKHLPQGSRLSFFYPQSVSEWHPPDDILAILLAANWPNTVKLAAITEHDVRKAISSLPPATRLATVLLLVAEFSYTEISEIIGVEVQIVGAWIRQGRRQLQQALTALAAGHRHADWSGSDVAEAIGMRN